MFPKYNAHNWRYKVVRRAKHPQFSNWYIHPESSTEDSYEEQIWAREDVQDVHVFLSGNGWTWVNWNTNEYKEKFRSAHDAIENYESSVTNASRM